MRLLWLLSFSATFAFGFFFCRRCCFLYQHTAFPLSGCGVFYETGISLCCCCFRFLPTALSLCCFWLIKITPFRRIISWRLIRTP